MKVLNDIKNVFAMDLSSDEKLAVINLIIQASDSGSVDAKVADTKTTKAKATDTDKDELVQSIIRIIGDYEDYSFDHKAITESLFDGDSSQWKMINGVLHSMGTAGLLKTKYYDTEDGRSVKHFALSSKGLKQYEG